MATERTPKPHSQEEAGVETAPATQERPAIDTALLEALGFGSDSPLMKDPKIFVDERFLAALLVEFESELGVDGAHAALFQIGLAHGFRDAERICHLDFHCETDAAPTNGIESPPLVMQLSVAPSTAGGLVGGWPEHHEANARLGRLGRGADASCWLSAGYTSGWLSGTRDADFLVSETACVAAGDAECQFEAWPVEDRSTLDPNDSHLPSFDRFRRFSSATAPAAQGQPAAPTRSVASQLDPDDEAVHIWGPVMVLPFTNADEALATMETLGRDSDITQVRVVVIDLRLKLIDDAFEAANLERLLEGIEAWGADIILTGVSPMSESAVATLETTHLLLRKDLNEAIATAFQIAKAQRHAL